MGVSVIIVNYNSPILCLNCIKSIYEQTKNTNFEIIVVDNNSTDDSLYHFKISKLDFKVIELNFNNGFGAANNVGIHRAKFDFIALINADTIFINDYLSILEKFMLQNNDCSISGGLQFKPNNDLNKSHGNYPTLVNQLFPRLFNNKKNYYYHDKNYTVDYINGSAMVFNKNLISKYGEFDEKFFLYFEEVDLSLRFNSDGLKCYIVPDAKIYHIGNATVKKDVSLDKYFKIKHFYKSRLVYFLKHKSFFIVVLLYFGIQIKLLVKLKFRLSLLHRDQFIKSRKLFKDVN